MYPHILLYAAILTSCYLEDTKYLYHSGPSGIGEIEIVIYRVEEIGKRNYRRPCALPGDELFHESTKSPGVVHRVRSVLLPRRYS